jgi:hypothetical protein
VAIARTIFIATLLLSGTVFAAEYVAYPAKAAGSDSLPYDTEYELKWDTGVPRWLICWYTGAGAWAVNDFDVSTLKSTHVILTRLGVYSQPAWPNSRWDGFRIALYAFRGVPGPVIWPEGGKPKFVNPTGPKGWQWFNVNWTLPKSNYSFMAGMEQYYDYPNCDPYCVDDNPIPHGHSWVYYGGMWGYPIEPFHWPYVNNMIRVRVETGHTFPRVEPASVGRVKALYY